MYKRQTCYRTVRDNVERLIPSLRDIQAEYYALPEMCIRDRDGAIQLTLKVFFHEGLNIAQTLAVESAEGADALVDYQLKR